MGDEENGGMPRKGADSKNMDFEEVGLARWIILPTMSHVKVSMVTQAAWLVVFDTRSDLVPKIPRA